MSTPSSETVVIVGGAIVGSSVAFFLRELGFAGHVLVVERDPTYRTSSTALSAASIRTQFGCAVNIRMSLFGADFFRRIKEQVRARGGYRLHRAWLSHSRRPGAPSRRAGVDMQRAEGADIAALTPAEAQGRFPWLNIDVGVATTGRAMRAGSTPGRC